MHLIDKDPMNPRHKALHAALKKKTKPKTYEYKSNPLLKMVPPKPAAPKPKPQEVMIRTVKRPPRMLQYGDKGYRPSDGKGVGH